MEDDFYAPLLNATSVRTGLVATTLDAVLGASRGVIIAILLAPLLIVITTRLLSGNESEAETVDGKVGRTVRLLPYWIPIVGHGFQFLTDPMKLMRAARDQSIHGIFALNLGATTVNVISDPGLVKGVMQQKESDLQFFPIGWEIVVRFFGIPNSSKPKYDVHWEELLQCLSHLIKEPHLSIMLKRTVWLVEESVPQMISFMEGEIDQQPWERFAQASFISGTETEINLMALMRDMMANASVSGMFGHALIEKYPDLLHDIYIMDAGIYFFLMGLPPWTPWPSVLKAHMARSRVWHALDDHQRALDATVDGKYVDSSWGDLGDVSEIIMKRNEIFRKGGFEVRERGDLSILWALVVNASLLVFWQVLHILATPGLLERIRIEVSPFVQISKPESIGKFFEAPKLTINHEGLSKNCPLFRSTYFEALRISGQPCSIRKVATDLTIPEDKKSPNPTPYIFHKGEYVAIPHDLHMLDPKYFKGPEKFDPERFLVRNEDGSLSTNQGTIRPYGGGPSMCKGRIFAERECLALVAGVLMFWDIEPTDKTGWVIPKQKKTTAISLPVNEVRIRIKRRRFEWDE